MGRGGISYKDFINQNKKKKEKKEGNINASENK